eukprot:11880891-Prorocentrum_lima.AAC.1
MLPVGTPGLHRWSNYDKTWSNSSPLVNPSCALLLTRHQGIHLARSSLREWLLHSHLVVST